eukprot:IDg15393t1
MRAMAGRMELSDGRSRAKSPVWSTKMCGASCKHVPFASGSGLVRRSTQAEKRCGESFDATLSNGVCNITSGVSSYGSRKEDAASPIGGALLHFFLGIVPELHFADDDGL